MFNLPVALPHPAHQLGNNDPETPEDISKHQKMPTGLVDEIGSKVNQKKNVVRREGDRIAVHHY